MLVTILLAQVRRLTAQVDELVNMSASQRIFRRIVALAEIYDATDPGTCIPVTQDQVAAMAGAGLRATTQVVAAARHDGILETGVRRIVVLDRDRVRALAGRGAGTA